MRCISLGEDESRWSACAKCLFGFAAKLSGSRSQLEKISGLAKATIGSSHISQVFGINLPPLKHRQRSTRRHKQTPQSPIRPANMTWVAQEA